MDYIFLIGEIFVRGAVGIAHSARISPGILGVLAYAVRARMAKVQTGMEGLIEETGIAKADIGKGKVSVHGKLWEAKSDVPVKIGEKLIIVGIEKLVIEVKKRRITKC